MNSRHGSAGALRRACRHRDAGLVRARGTVGRVRADLLRSLSGVLCDGAISHRGARSSNAFSSHSARTFAVWGHGGVPAHAIAVTGNLTVTQQTSLGSLYVGPIAANDPTSSTLNFPLGDDRANAVTVALRRRHPVGNLRRSHLGTDRARPAGCGRVLRAIALPAIESAWPPAGALTLRLCGSPLRVRPLSAWQRHLTDRPRRACGAGARRKRGGSGPRPSRPCPRPRAVSGPPSRRGRAATAAP